MQFGFIVFLICFFIGEKGFAFGLLGAEFGHELFGFLDFLLNGFAALGALLANLRGEAFFVFAVLSGSRRRWGGFWVALGQTQAAVVVEVAFESFQVALVDEEEAVGSGFEQAAVVRNDDERALETLQGHGEGVAHIEVEVVGGFVEQEQVGLLPHDNGQREAGFFAAGKAGDGLDGHVAGEVEAAEEVSDVLLFGLGVEALDVPERALVGAQGVELVLGEVADFQFVGADDLAALGLEAT